MSHTAQPVIHVSPFPPEIKLGDDFGLNLRCWMLKGLTAVLTHLRADILSDFVLLNLKQRWTTEPNGKMLFGGTLCVCCLSASSEWCWPKGSPLTVMPDSPLSPLAPSRPISPCDKEEMLQMNLSGLPSVDMNYYLLCICKMYWIIQCKLCDTYRLSTFPRDAWDTTRTTDGGPDWTSLPLKHKHGRFNTDMMTRGVNGMRAQSRCLSNDANNICIHF